MNKARVKCPECGVNGVALSSSNSADGRSRRYSCSSGHRFTTLEVVVMRGETMTIRTSKDGVNHVAREGNDELAARIMRAVEGALK